MKKETVVLSIFFVTWFLLTIFFGKVIITIIFLGIFAGVIFSGELNFSSDLESKIAGICFLAVFLGNIVYVLTASLFPELSWQHTDFTFWRGFWYVIGLSILNFIFTFVVFMES
jgi:hypothetical protein